MGYTVPEIVLCVYTSTVGIRFKIFISCLAFSTICMIIYIQLYIVSIHSERASEIHVGELVNFSLFKKSTTTFHGLYSYKP